MRRISNKFGFPAIATMCVATATLLMAVANAQDPKKVPAEATLKSGFTPDPYTVNLKAGGSEERTDGKVKHYVRFGSPDFRLNYTAGSANLFFRVESAGDTTLFIRGPGGVTYFNDDYRQGSLNPGYDFTTNRPKSGVYDVWVGSLKKGDFPNAKLIITERQ